MEQQTSIRSIVKTIGWIPSLALLSLFIVPVLIMTERTTDPALIIRHLITALILGLSGIAIATSKERGQWASHIMAACKSPIAIFLAAFVLLKALSFAVAVNGAEVLFELSSSLLSYCIYILLHASLTKNSSAKVLLISAIIMLNVALLVFGFYEFFMVGFQWIDMAEVGSQLINQNLFAPIFLLCTPFLLLAQKHRKPQKFIWVLVALNILMILFLQNRATYLALVLSGGVYFAWVTLRKIKSERILKTTKVLLCGFILIGTLAGAFLVKKNSHHFEALVNPKADTHKNFNSVTERFVLWNRSLQLISDNPVFGVGAGNWPLRVGEFGISDPGADRGSKYFLRPHNELLRILSEFGVIGSVPLFLLGGILARWLSREFQQPNTPIYVAGFIAILAISMFSFPTERTPLLSLILLLLAMSQTEAATDQVYSEKPWFFPVGYAILCLAMSGYFLLRFQNDSLATTLDKERRSKDWNRVMRLSEKIDQRIYNVTYFRVPIKFYSGLSLYHSGNIERALEHFSEALGHNPNHILTLTNLATCYSHLNKFEAAISTYQRALKVNPNFEKAKLNLAIAFYQNKQFEAAWNQIQICKNPPERVRRAIEASNSGPH